MNLRDELQEYSRDVITGKVIACQKHKWACARFLRDIDREDTEEFPYVFIEEKAERFLTWMRSFKHRKGILKGRFIDPHIIQKFVFGNVYGWYHRDTGYRRFKKMYWQVARKNAKSQSLACVGSYELMAFDETGEVMEVYCAATKTEQAKIVWDETRAMLNRCEFLNGAIDGKRRFEVKYGKIIHLRTDSYMRALSEEDRKTGDGLNPQCGIIDEYHAHETSEMYDIINSGMGARAQPLLAIITTAGLDLNHPCYRVEYDLCSKILNPDIGVNLDSYFVMINELDRNETPDPIDMNGRQVAPGELLDDITDETVWEKANPIQCSYPEGRDYIRKELAEALEAPEKMRNFLTKLMNVWVNQREIGYMNMHKWGICCIKSHNFSLKDCIIGCDLSTKTDLTSSAFVFPFLEVGKEKQYFVKHHSFIPSETLCAKEKTDKVPYRLWADQGWLSEIPGARINYQTVMMWTIEEARRNGWRILEWCLDPWGAAQITQELERLGYKVVEVIQGIKTLSEPTKNFRDEVYAGNVHHDGDPLLGWAISNAVVELVDRNKNIILSKKRSTERIDPIAAVINAYVRAMVIEPPQPMKIFFV